MQLLRGGSLRKLKCFPSIIFFALSLFFSPLMNPISILAWVLVEIKLGTSHVNYQGSTLFLSFDLSWTTHGNGSHTASKQTCVSLRVYASDSGPGEALGYPVPCPQTLDHVPPAWTGDIQPWNIS